MCSYFHTGIFYSIAHLLLERRSVSSIYIYVVPVSPRVPAVLQTECCSAPCGCPPAPTRPPRRSTRSRRPGPPSVSTSPPPGTNIFAVQKYFEESCNMRCSISAPLPLMVWKTYRRTLRSPFNRKLFLSSPNLPKRSTTESPPPRPNEVLLMEFSSCAFI